MEIKIGVQNENQDENQEADDEKKNDQFACKEILHEDKEKTLEKIYQENGFKAIHRPPKTSFKTLLTTIIVSFVFGLILGLLSAFFLFAKN